MTSTETSQWTTYPAILGSVLARHRIERGLGQVELVENLPVTQSTWSRIERGVAPITAEQLSEVAELFGLHPHQLLYEADSIAGHLRQHGVIVYHRRPADPNRSGLIAFGAGALAGLALALLANSGD